MTFMKQSVIIQKPLEEVFAAAIDFSNSPEVMDAVVDVELLSEGPVREGYRFKETRLIRGRKIPAVIEVSDFVRNESYSVRSVQNGLDLRYHYVFTEREAGSTEVTFRGEMKTEGIRNTMMKPLIQRIIKKEDEDHLPRLKKFIENRP
ncbi:UNVERIFIED_CONTAM: SRPBCC family protein [Halobacillus marinus]